MTSRFQYLDVQKAILALEGVEATYSADKGWVLPEDTEDQDGDLSHVANMLADWLELHFPAGPPE